MMRQKIKQMWGGVPSGLKRAIGFAAGAAAVAAEAMEQSEIDTEDTSDWGQQGGMESHLTFLDEKGRLTARDTGMPVD